MKTLKNIGRTIAALFRSLFKLIDRYIITPITKFILFLGEKTGKKTGSFERWLTRKNTLIILSLVIALGCYFIVDSKAILLVDSSAEVLYDQKVEATYNREAYVVEGLPETVDVTMIGGTQELYLAKQLASGTVKVDLSNYKEGTHKVSLKYDSTINSVNYKLDPSTVTVIIYPKSSKTVTAEVDILNKSALDSKLSIDNVTIDQDQIIIKGAEHTLEKVSTVKALVDIKNIINPKAGVTTLSDVKLVAYDDTGNVVDVEMVPNKVTATVSIVSPSKEVPVKIIPKGEVSFGKAISSMTSSVSKVIVYGDEDVLDELQYIPIEIDVNGLSENKTFDVKLSKPQGVRSISESSASVTISLGTEVVKEIDDVYIETINLNSNYKASALGENSSKITVIVKGTREVIDAIDAANIKAVVDLSEYGEGDHEVDIIVSGDELKATYTPKTTKIKIRITSK